MNCYGITEKRVRMQRERCISRLAPGHYKNSPFGKRYKSGKPTVHSKISDEKHAKNNSESFNGLEITPLDLSSDKKKQFNGTDHKVYSCENNVYSEENEKDQPLDLSHNKKITCPPSPSTIEIDKTKLYEIAEKIGVSKERIDKEMAEKYEQLVRQNLRKQQKLAKTKKRHALAHSISNYHNSETENRNPSMKAIAEQVVGLEDDFTILPIQTLNNGDLTITPVLGPVSKPVENHDIMKVNSFFQNQLWKPEYIGLSSWRKLRSQSYEI